VEFGQAMEFGLSRSGRDQSAHWLKALVLNEYSWECMEEAMRE